MGSRVPVKGVGLGVWGLGFGVRGLGAWGVGFRVSDVVARLGIEG